MQRRRLAKFVAMKSLQTFTSLKRVAKCGRVRSGSADHVHIRLRPNGRAHYANLQTCGSVHACPSCSEKILALRATEMQTALRSHWQAGGSAYLLTLTMRHDRYDRLDDLWDALSPAWGAASGGTTGTRALWDGIEWVARREATYGENGWHLHLHVLLFAPHGRKVDVEVLKQSTFHSWSAALQRQGLRAPELPYGADLKRLSLAGMRSEVAEYLAKGTYSGAEKLNEAARRAALEIASSGKTARRANRTPFQILEDFGRDGLQDDGSLWREWEQASHGRRAMTWSKGCRDRLVGDAELDDQAAAEESDGAGAVVAVIDRDVWPVIAANPVLRNRLLATVEILPDKSWIAAGLNSVLADVGIFGAVGPPELVAELNACPDRKPSDQ